MAFLLSLDFQSPGTLLQPRVSRSNNSKHERQTNSQVSGTVTKMHGKWTF